jgi:hypothetical protein
MIAHLSKFAAEMALSDLGLVIVGSSSKNKQMAFPGFKESRYIVHLVPRKICYHVSKPFSTYLSYCGGIHRCRSPQTPVYSTNAFPLYQIAGSCTQIQAHQINGPLRDQIPER